MRVQNRISLSLLAFFALSLSACSRSFWREETPTPAFHTPPFEGRSTGIHSQVGKSHLDALRQRAQDAGTGSSETRTIDALDFLNSDPTGRTLEGSELSQDLSSIAVRLLKDRSEEVRFRAAELLGKIATRSEENPLLECSQTDPSPSVREMAAEALEMRGLGEEVWKE